MPCQQPVDEIIFCLNVSSNVTAGMCAATAAKSRKERDNGVNINTGGERIKFIGCCAKIDVAGMCS